MNSSTLRRLAADYAGLHTSEVPPHYLFSPDCSTSAIPDDLTQLTILLTGPTGTPYSQGLWKLCLKIPEEYPKSPPKAFFRTRIWHPNVEEHTGSVCVDTLKKDWEVKLTLRDVLITISCLLIMPNPNSALNADAGHLLREDYDSFCRQARLMTSIHASIPSHLKEAALMAKRRGEEPGATALEVEEVKPRMKNKSISSSVVMKKKIPQRIMSTQSEPVPCSKSTVDEDSSNEEDEASESKENDPTLSPVPVPEQSPRKPALSKRPLSDLPIPTEVGREDAGSFCASSSQQNVMNNKAASSSGARSANSCKTVPPNEQAYGIRYAGRSLQDSGGNALITGSFEDHTHDYNARPAKRVCSEESMQNLSEMHTLDPLPEQPLLVSSGSSKSSLAAPRKASTTSSIGAGTVKGSLRVGLRRL